MPRFEIKLDQGPAAVARVSLKLGGALNVIGSEQMEDFLECMDRLASMGGARAVVLEGETERAFIGGADLYEMAKLDAPSARAFITRLHECCEAIRALPVPVIAKIRGYCLGAGLEVAAACDFRIGAIGSIYGMPEVLVGVPSVIEAALLPRLIGWSKTRDLLFTGRMIDAARAFEWGLIDRLAPEDELDAGLEGWLEGICAAAPNAIRLQKSLIRQWERLPLDESIAAGIDAFENAFETGEPAEYMQRFIDDRAAARAKRERAGAD